MSGILNSLSSISGKLGTTFQKVLDRLVPPEKRAEIVSKLQNFAINNPKLAAFLTTQIVLTGLPLLLFITFSITVFVFSLIVALLLGLLAAVLFTLFMVGVALLVVLPTIFMTTFTASFLFLWGLGGYYILRWFNEGDAPAPEGTSIGDKLNNFTGGRMSWLTDGARKKQDDRHTGVDQTPKPHGNEENTNGHTNAKSSGKSTPRKLEKENANEHAEGVQKRVVKNTGSVEDTAKTVKGATSGATGA